MTRPDTLDPALAKTTEQLQLAQQLFSTLVVNDPKTLSPIPGLASRWTASADQKEWDFVLRPGVVFSNNTPVTADDVKFSLERVAHGLPGAAGADLLSLVASVVVPAPGVVHISLTSPWSSLPSALASPTLSIVPAGAAGAATFGQAPVGSGPFTLAGRSSDLLTLRRSPGSPALLDGIDVHLYDTVAAAYQAFTSGKLDWSRVPVEEVEAAGRTYGRSLFEPYVAELFYAFNLHSPKFADVRFRTAISQAIDRTAVVSGVYQNTVRPSASLILTGVPGHVDGVCGSVCGHDVAAARASLAAAFPPGGPPVPTVFLDFDDDPTQQKIAEAIKVGLGEVGIPASLRVHPADSYADFLAGSDAELFRFGWVAPFPAADPLLTPLFTSGSPVNLTHFTSADVDAALTSARAEPDPARRIADYQGAEKAVLSSVAVIPIAQFVVYSVAAAGVHGLVLTAAGTFDPATVWLSPPGSGH